MNTRVANLPGTRVYRHKTIRFWHERGMIVMANEETDEQQVLAPSEAKLRVAAFYREAQRMREGGWQYRDETAAMLRTVRDLQTVVIEAKAYGDPFDPEVAAREAELQREIKVHMNLGGPPKLWLPGDPLDKPAKPLRLLPTA